MRCDVASRARVSLAPPASCARRSECVPQYGNTALIFAAANGRAEVIALLLKAGADIEAKSNVSRAPSRPAPSSLARHRAARAQRTRSCEHTRTRTHECACIRTRVRANTRASHSACLCEWCNARVAACCVCDGRRETADGPRSVPMSNCPSSPGGRPVGGRDTVKLDSGGAEGWMSYEPRVELRASTWRVVVGGGIQVRALCSGLGHSPLVGYPGKSFLRARGSNK